MDKKLLALQFADQAISLLFAWVVLVWTAGRLDWWPSWAVLVIWLIWFAAVDIIILRLNPGLLAERLLPPAGARGWDKALLSLIRLTELLRYILAGLDQRLGWTGPFPLSLQILGLLLCLAGTALFAWAMASNKFFSQVVRIQLERGHTVASSGPYAFIRHPGYAGSILLEVALSMLFASTWAILTGLACAALFIIRTAAEDKTLRAELPGYAEYTHRVRWRLLPGVW